MPISSAFLFLLLRSVGVTCRFTADANKVLSHLSQTNKLSMGGNYHGAKALTVASAHDGVGFTAKHLVTTGIESLYEGITIASVRGPVQQYVAVFPFSRVSTRGYSYGGCLPVFNPSSCSHRDVPVAAPKLAPCRAVRCPLWPPLMLLLAMLLSVSKRYRSLIRSSDGNVVTGCHDRNKVRILIDGGFTRLMDQCWDETAGTARFVTNAACWLYNWEGRQGRSPRAPAL